MSDLVEGMFCGFIVGAFITVFVVGIWAHNAAKDFYQTEAIARGYAHYELDHSFHWNNEKKE